MVLFLVALNILVISIYIFYLKGFFSKRSAVIVKFLHDTNPGTLIALSMSDSNRETNENLVKGFTIKWEKTLQTHHKQMITMVYITIALSLGGVAAYNHNFAVQSVILSTTGIFLISIFVYNSLMLSKRFIQEKENLKRS